MEFNPLNGIGIFKIGDSLRKIILKIQKNSLIFKKVIIAHDSKNPITKDIVLEIRNLLRLSFCSITHKLKIIRVNLINQEIKNSGEIIGGGKVESTLHKILGIFGSTFPGEIIEKNYLHHYMGCSFAFPIPKKFQNEISIKEGIPNTFSDQSPLIAKYGYVYKGEFNNLEEPIEIPKTIIIPKNGIKDLFFGSTPQDVIVKYGVPNRIFQLKERYIFNYFDLGIDFLFNLFSNELSKIILHTNFPSDIDFNHYNRCNFEIKINNKIITPFTNLKKIKKILGKCTRNFMHQGFKEDSLYSPPLVYSFIGYNFIFELLSKSKYIARVQIFRPEKIKKIKNLLKSQEVEVEVEENSKVENSKVFEKIKENENRNESEVIEVKVENSSILIQNELNKIEKEIIENSKIKKEEEENDEFNNSSSSSFIIEKVIIENNELNSSLGSNTNNIVVEENDEFNNSIKEEEEEKEEIIFTNNKEKESENDEYSLISNEDTNSSISNDEILNDEKLSNLESILNLNSTSSSEDEFNFDEDDLNNQMYHHFK